MIVLWIGASDTSPEGNFTWDNGGRPVSPGCINWGPYQPDNSGGAEDCVHYYPTTFTWNDIKYETLSVEFAKINQLIHKAQC